MTLEMTVEKLDRATAVADLSGSLTMGTSLKTVDSNLQTLIEDGVSRLVLDLSACPYADSAGLGLLMHLNGLIGAKGGAMRLCGVSDRIASLLTLTKTDAILKRDVDRDMSLMALDAAAM